MIGKNENRQKKTWRFFCRKYKKDKHCSLSFCMSKYVRNQMARSTLLERRHLVQTQTWRGEPSTIAFTRFTLGFHALLARLWEWETLMPNVTPLPQISHFANCCTSNHRKNHHKHGAFRRRYIYQQNFGRNAREKLQKIIFFSGMLRKCALSSIIMSTE